MHAISTSKFFSSTEIAGAKAASRMFPSLPERLDLIWRRRVAFDPLNRSHTNTLDLKEIKELIALMRKNHLSVFKMEKEGFKIPLKKGTDFQPVITTAAPVAHHAAAPAAAAGSAGDTPA